MAINRKLLNVSRIIHIYLSIALLIILVFFSLTGITLNHATLFAAEPEVTVRELTTLPNLPLDDNGDLADSPELAAFLQTELGLRRDRASINNEGGVLFVDYLAPGESALVEIDPFLGEAYFEHTDFGLVALLNDLHKARDTTELWKLLVDASGVLLVLFSLAGFVLLLPNTYRLKQVAVYTLVGFTLVGVGYWLATLA